MRKVVIAICICALPWVAPPGASAEALSLDDAVERALRHNPSARAAASEVEMAAGQAAAARADLAPRLGLQVSASEYDGVVFYERFLGPGAPGAVGGTDTGSFSSTLTGVLTVQQNLYTGGAVSAQARARAIEESLARQQLEQARRDIVFAVTKAYVDALLAERASSVAAAAVDRSQGALEVIQSRRAEEEALQVEILGAEARLEADRLSRVRADNDLRFALFELNRLLGRSPDEVVELTDEFAVSDAPIDTAAVERAVLEMHPAVLGRELQAELGEAQLDGARSHFRPKVRLEAFYADLDNELFFDGNYFGASVELRIPFVADIIAGRGAVRAAKAQREAAEIDLTDVTAAMRLAARQAARDVDEARHAVNVARRALEYREEMYRVTQSAFEETLATSADLQEASSELFEAELELQGALHAARLAEAELARLTGVAAGSRGGANPP